MSKTDNPTNGNTAQTLAALIKAARKTMRQDKGLSTDLDRLPMLTWLMFLKFLDDLERSEESKSKLRGDTYEPTIESPYRWRDWASREDGITGPELIEFVGAESTIRPDGTRGPGLLRYLRDLQTSDDGRHRRRTVIALVFANTENRIRSGYLLRDVINDINDIHFTSREELFTLGHIYESMLREMRDAAGENGEFYTPRPIVRFIVEVMKPMLGELVLDPACGTGGFLVEAFRTLEAQCQTVQDLDVLQNHSVVGGEAKPLPYLLCQMNLLLHGIETPKIDSGNSLRHRLSEVGDCDRVDVVLTNPPFGGEEEPGILANFPADMQTSETAQLFLQLIMRKLRRPTSGRPAGRAAIIVPNGSLFGNGVGARIRQHLIENFNLHTVVRLPEGVFSPYTDIPTNILFFDGSGPTSVIWYYDHPLPEGRKKYTKTKPITFEELQPLIHWWTSRTETANAWSVTKETIIERGFDLDISNPTRADIGVSFSPADLLDEIESSGREIHRLMGEIRNIMDEASR